MELDELKSQLKEKLATDHTGRSDADIAFLLRAKTNSVIGKLKKSLRKEIFLGVLVLLPLGYIGIASEYRSLRIYFSVTAVLCAAFLGLLIYLIKRINRLSVDILPVSRNLTEIVRIIEEFIRRYFQFTMALVPVCLIFAFFLGYHEPKHIDGLDHFVQLQLDARWKLWLVVIYLIGFTVLVYYFTKWYLRKLYGNYLAELKECMKELTIE
ncbi:MAG: hypothetical protein RLZZ28_1881 [Bacteroidota bacterium]